MKALISQYGDKSCSKILAAALECQWRHGFPHTPKGVLAYTAGFHPYMAGLQLSSVRMVLPLLTMPRGGCLLDPFAGSGTTLVEGTAQGLQVIGSDLSPLAAFISANHTWRPDDSDLARLRSVANDVATKALVEIYKNESSESGLAAWSPLCVVLHEQSSHEAQDDANAPLSEHKRDDLRRLWFCLSAAISKLGRRMPKARKLSPSDCLVTFLDSVDNYSTRIDTLAAAAKEATKASGRPQLPAHPEVYLGDARSLLDFAPHLSDPKNPGWGVVDGILSSPPYPGVYDYLSEARRARELLTKSLPPPSRGVAMSVVDAPSLDPSFFIETEVPRGRDWPSAFESSHEIGAHKAMKKCRGATNLFRDDWSAAEASWMRAIAAVLKPGARAALVLGDGAGIDGLESARSNAVSTGLFSEVASASIRRPTNVARNQGYCVGSSPTGDEAASGAPLPGSSPPGNRRAEHFLLIERSH